MTGSEPGIEEVEKIPLAVGDNTENIVLYKWHTQIIRETRYLMSIYFTDNQNGWAAGTNKSCEGVIIKTSDGGNRWSAPQVIPGTKLLYSVCFTDSRNEWAAGNYFDGAIETGYVLKYAPLVP